MSMSEFMSKSNQNKDEVYEEVKCRRCHRIPNEAQREFSLKKQYYRVTIINYHEFDCLIFEDFDKAMAKVADQMENAEVDESVTIQLIEMTEGQYADLGIEE